jgi:hypothetical protein
MMRSPNRTWMLGTLVLSAAIVASACDDGEDGGGGGGGAGGGPAAQILNQILRTQLVGSADDGDSANQPDRYNGPGDLDATDQRTRSSSVAPAFNRVSGAAEAESFDPASQTLTDDAAVATSNNKVVSRLRVTRAIPLTFDIDLDVDRVEVRNGGTVEIQVVAAILDAQGNAVPGGGITNINFRFQPNAAGGIDVIVQDDADPENTEPNGDYDRTLSGPNGGIALQPGNYQIELDLRIRATAPIQTGPDGRRDRAAVESAKATIRLR